MRWVDPVRGGSRDRRRRASCRLAALALHEFRLQPALRLLLRALLAQGAAPGARPRARTTDRRRGGRARRRRDLRDRRRAVSASRHRRDPGGVRRRGADDGADQRHAVRGAAARDAARAAARPRDPADQPRQPDAGAARPPSRKRHLGARLARHRARPGGRLSRALGGDRIDRRRGRGVPPLSRRRADRRAGPGDPPYCSARLRGTRASPSRVPTWCPKSRSPPTACIGIRSGPRMRTCLVTRDIFPLAEAFAAVRRAFARESEHQRRLATIFNCA